MIVIVIAVVVMIALVHAAAFADFVELPTAILRLPAVFAMLANSFLQVCFRFLYVVTALVLAVGAGGRGHSCQQRCAQHRTQQRLSEHFPE